MAELARTSPELAPALLAPDELREVEPAVAPGALGLPARHRLPGAPGRRDPRVRQARLRRRRALPRGREGVALGDRRPHARGARGRRAATRRRSARGGWALDARGDRPHPRLAADRAGVGSRGGCGDGRSAPARARGGGSGGGRRRWSGVDLQPGPGGRAGLGGLHLPARGARRARVGADAAARGRALRARAAPGEGGRRARLRAACSPSMGGRWSASCRTTRASGRRPGTGPGESRPGRPPRGWPRTRC